MTVLSYDMRCMIVSSTLLLLLLLSIQDEFNRINIEVLSVVSAQIRAIQNALNAGRSTVDIGLGTEMTVNYKVGIFITMVSMVVCLQYAIILKS